MVTLQSLFPSVDALPVTLGALPAGKWAMPIADLVATLKIVSAVGPRRVLELGSYRGNTAKAIAEHLDPEASLTAVDIDPAHGASYLNTSLARRIDRRVGSISPPLFAHDAPRSFDLVLIDAEHTYDAVKHDTETIRRLVSHTGWLLWHDYSNFGALSGLCGVPEYLHELAEEIPVVHIAGTGIALHRPSWCTGGRGEYERAVRQSNGALRPS